MSTELEQALQTYFVLAGLICAYFFPSIIASLRKHGNEWPIVAANFFFGWTFVGWLICLVWSLTNNVRMQEA